VIRVLRAGGFVGFFAFDRVAFFRVFMIRSSKSGDNQKINSGRSMSTSQIMVFVKRQSGNARLV
jgi:hypothetical protein